MAFLKGWGFCPFCWMNWTPLDPIRLKYNGYNTCDMHVMKHEGNLVSFIIGLFNNLDLVKPNGSEFDLKLRIV